MNYFYLGLIQCVLAIIATGNKFSINQTPSHRNHLETYECLETIQIAFLLPATKNQEYYNTILKLMKTVENSCHTIYYFDRQSQNVVQWQNDQNQFEVHHKENELTGGPEYIDFLDHINQQHRDGKKWLMENDDDKSTITNILVLDIQLDDKILKIVEQLKNDVSYLEIIIMCEHDHCPIIPNIPIQHIVPKDYVENTENQVRELVHNPHFNKFEFLKYVKLDGGSGNNTRLKCLENKTIHIYHGYLSVKLLENIVLVAHNIRELYSASKIVLYLPDWKLKGKKFWNHYMVGIGLLNNLANVKIVFVKEPPFKPLPANGTDADIYFINDITITLMFMSMKHFCSRQSVVFYGSLENSEWYDNWNKNYFNDKCKKSFKKVAFKQYESKDDLEVDFIDELLNISCF